MASCDLGPEGFTALDETVRRLQMVAEAGIPVELAHVAIGTLSLQTDEAGTKLLLAGVSRATLDPASFRGAWFEDVGAVGHVQQAWLIDIDIGARESLQLRVSPSHPT